jgi:hypothetical protein
MILNFEKWKKLYEQTAPAAKPAQTAPAAKKLTKINPKVENQFKKIPFLKDFWVDKQQLSGKLFVSKYFPQYGIVDPKGLTMGKDGPFYTLKTTNYTIVENKGSTLNPISIRTSDFEMRFTIEGPQATYTTLPTEKIKVDSDLGISVEVVGNYVDGPQSMVETPSTPFHLYSVFKAENKVNSPEELINLLQSATKINIKLPLINLVKQYNDFIAFNKTMIKNANTQNFAYSGDNKINNEELFNWLKTQTA